MRTLNQLRPEEVHVGMPVITANGKKAKIAPYRFPHHKTRGDRIINDCVNIDDDGALFIDIEGEPGWGHTTYLSHSDQIQVVT
jgi:hypothetical protein